jgi:hypothetical protein
MIAIIVAGVAFIVVVAFVVGIVDSIQAPAWRRIARERRRIWEERQYEMQGPRRSPPWDE